MNSRPISKSLSEYARGIAGGIIFSIPLLFTMEVWWQGFIAHPSDLIYYIIVTFLLLLGYNNYAGLRKDATWTEVLIDSVEEMGLGILISVAVLFLLNRINLQMPFSEVVGVIVVESMTVAIGVSIGTAQLGDDNPEDKEDKGREEKTSSKNKEAVNVGKQLTLSLCGAVIFAANIAFTEEVVMLGFQTPPWKLLILVVISLILGLIILHFSSFRGTKRYGKSNRVFYFAYSTAESYFVAFIVSAMMLYFFGRFSDISFFACVAQIVVLSFPSSLGSSAGRLLLE